MRERPDAQEPPRAARKSCKSPRFRCRRCITENRGVPGSSPGLAISETPANVDIPPERPRDSSCAQADASAFSGLFAYVRTCPGFAVLTMSAGTAGSAVRSWTTRLSARSAASRKRSSTPRTMSRSSPRRLPWSRRRPGSRTHGSSLVSGPAKGGPADGPEPDRQGGRVSEPEGLEGPSAGLPTCGSASTHTRRAPGSAWVSDSAGEQRSAARRAAWSGSPAGASPGWDQRSGLVFTVQGVSGAHGSVRGCAGAVAGAPDGAVHRRAGYAEELFELANGVLPRRDRARRGGLRASG
jgi:hypothetical protein